MIEVFFITLMACALLFIVRRGKTQFSAPQTSKASPRVLQSYEAVPSLFVNASERALFLALARKLPRGFMLMTKVRMEDIVRVKRTIKDPKQVWQLRGRVKSRHVDFLITDFEGVPKLVIELDGSSHDNQGAANADALKDGIFSQCGVQLMRVQVGEDFESCSKRAARMITS